MTDNILKKSLYRVFGNDSKRCIYVDPEELHPQSRLKNIMTTSTSRKIAWGCPRDTVLSIVASQRYNKLITKGQTTEEELLLELDRDCVDIELELPCTHPKLISIIKNLVEAILEWPLLKRSMELSLRGVASEWTCGNSFFYLFFPRKIYISNLTISNTRPVKELMMYLSMEISSWEEYIADWSADEVRNFLVNINTDKVLSNITDRGENPFWFMKYDNGRHTECKMNSSALKIYNELQEIVRTDKKVQLILRKLNDTIPNLEMLLHNTPLKSMEQKILEHMFMKKGYAIHWICDLTFNSFRPITFPTMWHAPRNGSSLNTMLYIQCC